MKIEFWLLLVIVLVTATGSHVTTGGFLIFKSKNGKETHVSRMAKELAKQQVVFFGEYHDDAVCHAVELELLKGLYAVNPKIVVSFEMFERDVQSVIDDYLSDKISEEEFLADSRPWGNYETDYRPLVEFAKKHRLPVIAANVPRSYAGLIARQGKDAFDSIPTEERANIASKLVTLNDEYKKEFFRTMQQSMAHGMPGMPDMYENMYAAQCLKDDTMAESIRQAMRDYHGHLVIHYNGDFHSRRYLGTAQKLQMLMPKAKMSVITPQYLEPQKEMTRSKISKSDGDYIILIHKQLEKGEDID